VGPNGARGGAWPWLGAGGRPGAAVVGSMESRVSVHEEPREPAWSSPPEQEPAGVPHPSLELPAGASNFRFPPGFLWGAATSAHQVEGNNIHHDWWARDRKS